MQPECAAKRQLFPDFQLIAAALMLLSLLALGGCEQTITTLDPQAPTPHTGTSLRVSIGSSVRHPELVEAFAREWSSRTGAAVTIETGKPIDFSSADVAIIEPAELPALAEAGVIDPVPTTILGHTHSYQWDDLLPVYSNVLSRWRGVTFGVPLLGAGRVLVYRPDMLSTAKIDPPTVDREWSWEDFLAAAQALTRSGMPSLPPLPATAEDLETEFHLIASCYDRPAISRVEAGAEIPDEPTADRMYSYHYRIRTAESRINAPAFVHALELLRQMMPCRLPGAADVPGEAFRNGKAALCVATLSDLGRFQQLDSPVRGKFRIVPLPGSRFTFELDGRRVATPAGSINRMPYLASGEWFGVVSKNSAHPQTAFEFLTDFAHPEKMGAEAVTAAKWGAGPIRSVHTEERALGLWLGYDLPGKETDAMLDAVKKGQAVSVINPRYRLRLPNWQAHLTAFDKEVRSALLAEKVNTQQTLNSVNEKWESLWKDIPAKTRRQWVRTSHGLESAE
jgi:ABC-type glycerol-3-phosphate transport system substrate-binding protein